MAATPQLEVARMTDRALYKQLLSDAAQLNNYGFTSLKPSEVRAIGLRVFQIGMELKARGVQLQLPLG
jgi:hypothetical protein